MLCMSQIINRHMQDSAVLIINSALQLHIPFTARSLPRTYSHFMTKEDLLSYTYPNRDHFDYFLQQRVCYLSEYIDRYYDNKNPSPLRLSQIADVPLLLELDNVIVNFLRNDEGCEVRTLQRSFDLLKKAYRKACCQIEKIE